MINNGLRLIIAGPPTVADLLTRTAAVILPPRERASVIYCGATSVDETSTIDASLDAEIDTSLNAYLEKSKNTDVERMSMDIWGENTRS